MRGPVAFLIVLTLVAGCLGAPEPTPAAPPTESVTDRPATSFLHNVTEPDTSIRVVDQFVEHLAVAAPDGIVLDTWIVRPRDATGPVPVVAQVTPYYQGGDPTTLDAIGGGHAFGRFADVVVQHGYAYALSSVRGTGNSGGCFTQGSLAEGRDTAAVIEHLARQPWSNGNVGLIGVSYPGTTPQQVWLEAPPALKTIVPISGISDFYDYNFVNGVPINIQGYGFNSYYWAMVGLGAGTGGVPMAVGHVLDPASAPQALAGEACAEQVAVQEGGVSSTIDGNKDAYWQERDFAARLSADWDRNEDRASVFYIHGLQDWNVKPHMMEGWLDLVQDTGVPFKAWLGQWTHNYPQREDWWNATLIAWFDQFLKGIETGVLDMPAVQVQDDLGRWRHENRWPPTDIQLLTLHPASDGTLGPTPGTGSASYHDRWSMLAPDGPGAAQALWVSEPFATETTLSGMPRFVGNASADAPRAALILTLAERNATTGKDRAFNFAALSLNHAADITDGNPDISGDTVAVDLLFFPQDDVIEAGNRLVLIAAGNTVGGPGPGLLPPSTGATITLDLAGARLEVPIDRTLSYETVQPCWNGQEEHDRGDRDHACYIYPDVRWP